MYSSVAFCFKKKKKAPELCKLQVPQNLDPPVARTKSLGKQIDTLNAKKASEPIIDVHLSEIRIFRELKERLVLKVPATFVILRPEEPSH